jgi:predicted GNAT family acetyltransferase
MDVQRHEDPRGYAERVLPLLLRAPARHNLMLGILDTLQRHPTTFPAFHLWEAQDGGDVVGAALQTPPHDLVLADPTAHDAVHALVAAITAAGVHPPGVVGGLSEVQAFADAWVARHGGAAETLTRQGIYELTTVRAPAADNGEARPSTTHDLPLLADWVDAFLDEAAPHYVRDHGSQQRRIAQLVDDGGYWLWEADGRVVSMTGVSPAPPGGARIGPVYTPPADRGRGYASSLVASVSEDALTRGSRACYLHTDLANATSNRIYQRIGYDWVCEANQVRFVPSPS